MRSFFTTILILGTAGTVGAGYHFAIPHLFWGSLGFLTLIALALLAMLQLRKWGSGAQAIRAVRGRQPRVITNHQNSPYGEHEPTLGAC